MRWLTALTVALGAWLAAGLWTDPVGAQHAGRAVSAPPACSAASLGGRVELTGAAGQREGPITLTNRGAGPCVLRGVPKVSIARQNGATLAVRQVAGPMGAYGAPLGGVELVHGQQAQVLVSWGNYCGANPGSTHLRVRLPSGGTLAVYQTGPFGHVLPVAPCLGTGEPSHLGVSAFLPGDLDAANGVLNYYGDINTHLFKDAYTMLGGAKPSLATFTAGYRDTARVSIDLVATPLYSVQRGGAAYSCVGVHFTGVKTNGGRMGFGGWYLVRRTAGPTWTLIPARSVIRPGSALVVPRETACAAHVL